MIKQIANFNPRKSGISLGRGFTLVELLVVIAIIAILTFLAVPAIQSIQKSGGFAKAVYDQSDALNLARSYALANNTYVYVGLAELDRTQSASAVPQTSNSWGGGKVAMAMVTTKAGTSYADSLLAAGGTYGTGSFLQQIRPVQVFDGLHIATGAFPAGTGTMARPTTNVTYLGTINTTPTTLFSLPLGSALDAGKYNFATASTSSWVICFNPQGGVLFNGNTVQWTEIDLQPVAGNAVPIVPTDVNKGNQAALVIDGATGSTTVYRP